MFDDVIENANIKILLLSQNIFLELTYSHAEFQEHTNKHHNIFDFLSLFKRFFEQENGEREKDPYNFSTFLLPVCNNQKQHQIK